MIVKLTILSKKCRLPYKLNLCMQDWEDYIKTVKKLKTKGKKLVEVSVEKPVEPQKISKINNKMKEVKVKFLPPENPAKTKKETVSYGFPNSHVERAVKSKRLKIQAKLDLHDLNLENAYRKLSGFIINAHNNNLKFLLVVTGKSAVSATHKSTIKREFLHWLEANSELSEKISFYVEAFSKDGGAGAFYVFLR